ncbi:MAG TPA: protocatechuate 3,4-dioxygenase subunit alpha [Mycobacteriales bacterium]|nr:protocatechuate 3,4-dioxygenase subunit alpha [Mycobacteriales bacterium]
MTRLPLTPAQTVGPYLHLGLPWPDGPFAAPPGTPHGIWLRGTVTDGTRTPVTDAMIETWQADPEGRFAHPDDPRGAARRHYDFQGAARRHDDFRGFARCPTDAQGRYAIFTVKPGPVPGSDGRLQAPHLDMSVFARGLLDRVVTRVYFPDEPDGNAADQVLRSVPPERRDSLIAVAGEDGLVFDVRLQGEQETVFFAL